MNVLFVAQRYHPYPGGVETQTRLVVHELMEQGHDVEVAAINFEKNAVPQRLAVLQDSLLIPSYDSYDDEGVPVHALTPSAYDRLRMLPIAARAIPRVRRYFYHELRDFGYQWYRRVYVPKLRARMKHVDVVHSVAGGYFGWAAQEAARKEGVPFVVTPYVHPGQHGDGPRDVQYYQDSDAVLALLETDQEILTDLGVSPEKVHLYGVVPLLPDSTHPDRFRAKHALDGQNVVLFVGSMAEYKGYPALINSAERVWETHPETRFLFIGPGDDELHSHFEQLDDRVRYLGFVSKQEKADALAACDLFCMPSRHEILPAVYLEAWSYAKPVIGGPAHGLKSLIEGNDAGVVVPQEPQAIATEIATLLGDPARRKELGRNGRQLVRERYSTEALVNVLETVYSSVRGSDRAAPTTA